MTVTSSKALPLRSPKRFSQLVQASKPNRILEFGSWQGRSAVTLLTVAAEQGLDAEILCVDTWLGSLEHWDGQFQGEWSYDQLLVVGGEPRIIDTFMENIAAHGFTKRTRMLRCETRNCAVYVKNHFPDAGLVYVDADHSTEAVLRDIAIAYDVAPGALVSGDDWEWSSVRRAVLKYAARHHLEVVVCPKSSAWALLANRQGAQRDVLIGFGWRLVSLGVERLRLSSLGQSVDRLNKRWRRRIR